MLAKSFVCVAGSNMLFCLQERNDEDYIELEFELGHASGWNVSIMYSRDLKGCAQS